MSVTVLVGLAAPRSCLLCGHIVRRHGSSWKQRVLKREVIKNTVVQYAGDKVAHTDRVYVWGYAATGALGMRTYMRPERHQRPIPRQMYPARMSYWDMHNLKVKSVACGYGFTVFVVENGKKAAVYGTGINTDSQIGRHEHPPKSGRILDMIIEPVSIDVPVLRSNGHIEQVACGRAHTVILTNEGVYSLGNNCYGQCGRSIIDNETYRANPLIHKITKLPDNISQVVCGQDHTVFVTDGGQVYSCGLGSDGQTGLGHYKVQAHPEQLSGDLEGEKVVQVAGSADCMLAVSDKGEIFGWGNSEYGQLWNDEPQVSRPIHLPMTCGRVRQVAVAGAMCALVNDAGEVYVWGYGILGLGPAAQEMPRPTLIPPALFGRNELKPDSRVERVYAGMNHFAALTYDGEVYVWGNNINANLGIGHRKQQFFPLKVSVPAEVKSVACGVDHMAVIARSFC